MPLFTAIAAALDVTRASIIFAPIDHDVPGAKKYIQRFYEKASRSAGIPADAKTLAELEIDYWVVHRKLAGERQQDPSIDNLAPLVDSLVALHAALFQASPEATRRSAEFRAQAAQAVDRITGRYSSDVAEDWRQVEAYLQKAYQAVAQP